MFLKAGNSNLKIMNACDEWQKNKGTPAMEDFKTGTYR